MPCKCRTSWQRGVILPLPPPRDLRLCFPSRGCWGGEFQEWLGGPAQMASGGPSGPLAGVSLLVVWPCLLRLGLTGVPGSQCPWWLAVGERWAHAGTHGAAWHQGVDRQGLHLFESVVWDGARWQGCLGSRGRSNACSFAHPPSALISKRHPAPLPLPHLGPCQELQGWAEGISK